MSNIHKINLKQLMLVNEWSTEFLAEKLNLEVETIEHWESGHLTPSRREIIDIHRLLDNDVE